MQLRNVYGRGMAVFFTPFVTHKIAYLKKG